MRGRDARTPTSIPIKGWVDIGWRVFNRTIANRVALIAAGIAFYGLLALFPSITAAVAVVGIAFEGTSLLESSSWLLVALPSAASEIIVGQVISVTDASDDSLGVAALLAITLAFWSASRGVAGLIDGLNVVYHEEESRGFFKLKLITVALTIAMIVGLTISIIFVAAIPTTLAIFGGSPWWKDITAIARWPLMFAFGVMGIAVLYRFAPSRRKAKWKWISPGALLACLLWVLATVAFSLFVQSFDTYNKTFGALGGVVIMLTWLWISAFVVLLGAQVDAEIEAQTKVDSTVGPERPMGQRGAFKADNLGEAIDGSDAA